MHLINYDPSHVGWKKFGALWSTNKKVIGTHIDPPKWTFFERLFQNDQGLLAQTQNGDGVACKILKVVI